MRRSSRPWQVDVHWRSASREMRHATIKVDALPRSFDTFQHPDIAGGQRMQITALNIDERQRRLKLDLA